MRRFVPGCRVDETGEVDMKVVQRIPTAAGVALICRWEAFRAHAYVPLAGDVPTIGYGTTRYPDGRAVSLDDPPITEPAARRLLLLHLAAEVAPAIARLIRVPLAAGEYDALCSFTYNLGGGALQSSTLRAKVNRGDFEGAAAEFPKWCRAGGRVVEGLRRRRLAEQARWLEPRAA